MTIEELRTEIRRKMDEVLLRNPSVACTERILTLHEILMLTWEKEPATLEEWIGREYRRYDRDYRESESFEEYEQAAYDRGQRAAYFAVLAKIKRDEENDN